MHSTVLVVEDDETLRDILRETIELGGYRARAVGDGRAALECLGSEPVNLVISDVQMTPMGGNELLREIRRRHADLPVLLMTAYGSIPSAVAAMQDGAQDYLVKPFEPEVLVSRIAQFLPAGDHREPDMVAEDPATRAVLALARRVAPADTSVMITGPSGVGKEVLFRFIHRHSRRAAREPVAINCAAIPENMLEAVLFGYEKGAYTGAYKSCPGKFEQASGSTLLLDEISEMSLPLQAKLLRVLQECQVERLGGTGLIDLDVRIIATSNRDLPAEVTAGRFREDLYYRLNVFPLSLPALRRRPADILPMARRSLRLAAQSNGMAVPQLTAPAEAALLAYHWPGNVRELDNVMQRACILQLDGRVDRSHLSFLDTTPGTSAGDDLPDAAEDDSLSDSLKDRERLLILEALREGSGSRKYASDKLGISTRTLRYKIARMREDGVAVPGR